MCASGVGAGGGAGPAVCIKQVRDRTGWTTLRPSRAGACLRAQNGDEMGCPAALVGRALARAPRHAADSPLAWPARWSGRPPCRPSGCLCRPGRPIRRCALTNGWAAAGLGEVLLPGALACADRVNVSAEQWHTLLRRRWDGRLLLLKPRPAGEEYAQPPFAEQATYESFFLIGQASARRAPAPAAARPMAAAPRGSSDAALP